MIKWFRNFITIDEHLAVRLIRAGFVVVLIIFVFFLWAEFKTLSLNKAINDSKFGQLGSILSGAVGTLWALAGVVLFYVTLQNQISASKENKQALKVQQDAFGAQISALHDQVEQFKIQSSELKATRNVYVEQLNTQSLQRFENTFFQMLSLHNNLVNSMQIRKADGVNAREGRDCFQTFINLIDKRYNSRMNESPNPFLEFYMETYEDNQAQLGHYFRNLYHVFKFVDNSVIEDKRFYTGLIRAQLSTNELLLICYNCLTENGIKKFKPLIERYSVFKNLPIRLVRGGKDLVRKYDPNAYGKENFDFLNEINQDWF